jgi:hypothetical protein
LSGDHTSSGGGEEEAEREIKRERKREKREVNSEKIGGKRTKTGEKRKRFPMKRENNMGRRRLDTNYKS